MKEKRDETIILRLSKTEKNRIYEKMFSMRLSLQPTRTGTTFIITLSTTPLRWTAPGNSGIFYCPGWLCNG